MATHNGKVVLTGQDTWDAWIQSMSAKIPRKIWAYMHPDNPMGELLAEPREPQWSDYGSSATDYSQLTQTQQRSYDAAFRQWEFRQRQYSKQETEVSEAYTTVLESVSDKLREPLDRQETLRSWMQLLKATAAPSEGYMLAKVKDQYNMVMKSFKGQKTFLPWLDKWETMLVKAQKYHLPETENGQWLREFADLIEPMHQSYATIFSEKARELDANAVRRRRQLEEALAFQTSYSTPSQRRRRVNSSNTVVSEINVEAEDGDLIAPVAQRPAPEGSLDWTVQKVAAAMREWAIRHKPTSGSTVRGGAFHVDDGDKDSTDDKEASTPKGRKRTRTEQGGTPAKRPVPECPACGMRGHDLPDCWYVFDEKRPEGTARNEYRLRKAKKALEGNSELQKKVDAIRKAEIN
ncbi:hypothetical protein PLICBS_010146 [Purpureocillium lilacinum]|uniref:uncharacterized protein n=1 Tax=Purpureocillium lilacinum TaxID=33203 RepID=UPI00208C1D67|nr:hypothetical protein PLICBS_000075 [Purpureocillium lilacinum]GJN76035.1 hypothetical protein PLICBS_010146 [Purpureocillium lilacinum]